MTGIPERPIGPIDEYGERKMRRVMSAEEIRERAELNVANTASRLRARVLANSNGHAVPVPDFSARRGYEFDS